MSATDWNAVISIVGIVASAIVVSSFFKYFWGNKKKPDGE